MSINLNLKITGNPFIDAGIFALSVKLNKPIEDITIGDIENEAKFISKLYLKDGWNKNMYSIFPNSPLVNNAIKGDRSEKYFNELKSEIECIQDIQDNGSCMGCGRRNAEYVFGKSIIPLTGSKSLKNYFSFANEGADYCSLCAILVQFSPLLMYTCGGKFILLNSDSELVMKLWAKETIQNVNTQVSLNNYAGCCNDGITRPVNAIFEIITKVIDSSDLWDDENPSLNFYYFTNYNQGPELEIYTLPIDVFNFLVDIPSEDKYNWKFILKKGYQYVKWDKEETFDKDKKNYYYKNKPNNVYNNLLMNRSILKYFYNFKHKKTYCSWKLVNAYMREVRKMDEKRIEAIKTVGDKLSDYIKINDSKKTLSSLENASSYNNFRNVLRKILKNKIKNDDDLLFTFDDYVINLFPEGNLTWKETQDLLLFRIYENLHNWMVENDFVEEISEEELLEE
ncbi:type I-B CRISPR-associated protein Cas8b1/Cst1 [uncultured Methanobrevibacter sp.]|uniref:type I-B CRISPR-associated protein Cas8b1/Cst1 n=1 Tax=uncultured Methanobrevibacter sp. TaxID=253161 RepID=UPI00260B1440|nr:type I-B CRISPR-associated protein Cas8b1/Cst1 [uncultured Methanobrevibacter sp.]